MMNTVSGKLAFAYQTIANLEGKIKQLTDDLKIAQSMHVDSVRWIWEERGFGHCSEMAEKLDALASEIPNAFKNGYLKSKIDHECELGYCKTELDEAAEQYAAQLRAKAGE